MPVVIVVGNEKGGCGKTTLSVNMAALAAANGLDVMLVDADRGQQSAARWAARRAERPEPTAPVRCVSLSGRTIGPQVEDLAKRYDMVIVDTGAEDSPELRACALVADVLVVPVQPEPLDLWTLPTVQAIFDRAATLNPKLRVVMVVNRVPHQTLSHAPDDVREWLRETAPTLATWDVIPLVGRAAYGRAIAEGAGVGEVARPDGKALTEMSRLYDEVMR